MEKAAREHLVRLLEITNTSPVDDEVLRAIKSANSLLTSHGQTWEDIITYKTVKAPGEGVAWAMTQDIPEVFEEILEGQEEDTSGWDFIVSLQEQFEKNGALSEKQYSALKKFLENTRNPPWGDDEIDYDGDPSNYYD